MCQTFTDLHTHILPGVDDGARNLPAALELLRWQKERNVSRIALTPHFYPMRESLVAFLERRSQAYAALLEAWDSDTMPALQLGAEVRFSPLLAQMDLRCLTIGNSDYLLLELPDTGVPTHIEEIADIMLMQGVTPILAHVERCAYFRQDPERLFHLVQKGLLGQISARAFSARADRRFVEICMRNGLAHIIASDIHTLQGRDTSLADAARKLSQDAIYRAEEFAYAVWENTAPPAFSIYPVQKGMFGYY